MKKIRNVVVGGVVAVLAALTSGSVAQAQVSQRIPHVVKAWADAWNSGDAAKMASLFTDDGTYQDNAFQVAMSGQEGVANWVEITERSIRNAHVDVQDAFRSGDRIAVRWTFSGTDTGAFDKTRPATGKSFRVPVSTLIDLRGERIRQLTDYYNLADVLRQVGLPAGPWTPPGS
ncbi:nuclear transport factor 2 family protein [Amycolatopsis sp. NPDC059090]|uniref:nuclear transport factor 2 family protein n=1 Tax=unclassified Amycolatopsis TaxID=2618356 RepID=UPI00366C7F37